MKLFLVVLGGTPEGRNVEQHDVAFVVGESLEDTHDALRKHWPIQIHIDSYVAVEEVDGFKVGLSDNPEDAHPDLKLFFINLGGYKPNDLEEYHKKFVLAAPNLQDAKAMAKQDVFFEDGLTNETAATHVDNKMAVDDILLINEQLPSGSYVTLSSDPGARFDNNVRHPMYYSLN